MRRFAGVPRVATRPILFTILFLVVLEPLISTTGFLKGWSVAAHHVPAVVRTAGSRSERAPHGTRMPLATPIALRRMVVSGPTIHAALSAAAQADILPSPPVLARAALLYDVTDGRILYEHNSDARLPMASTTKIMTAYLTIQHGHLDDWVTASAAAAAIGQSTMYLQQGERLRVRDLLYGLLLPSGNDAAIALAEHVAGSQARFVSLMNAEARRLGMAHTHYVTPHGLDAPGHFTSARDMVRLTLAAMRLPLFRTIVSTRYYTIPATSHNVLHRLININQPLWWYPGTVGVKPGTTDAAGRCAVEWVVRGHRTLLLIVLGDVNLVTDVRDLLNYGFGDFGRWISPTQAPVVYAPEYFSWDTPDAWLPTASGGRYYVRTGYSVKGDVLTAFLQGGGLAHYGPPTSQEYQEDGIWRQRFAGSWLFFNPRTGSTAPRLQEVMHP